MAKPSFVQGLVAFRIGDKPLHARVIPKIMSMAKSRDILSDNEVEKPNYEIDVKFEFEINVKLDLEIDVTFDFEIDVKLDFEINVKLEYEVDA